MFPVLGWFGLQGFVRSARIDAVTYEEEYGALSHENIVRLLHVDVSSVSEKRFVFEYCDASLNEIIPEILYHGPVPTNSETLVQLAEGLDYVHGCGIVYGKIVPSKALVCSRVPCVKWADFVTSKPISPDLSLAASIEIDVFNLGCLYFWFLCGGNHPYGGDAVENYRTGNRVNAGMIDGHPLSKLLLHMMSDDSRPRLSDVILCLKNTMW